MKSKGNLTSPKKMRKTSGFGIFSSDFFSQLFLAVGDEFFSGAGSYRSWCN